MVISLNSIGDWTILSHLEQFKSQKSIAAGKKGLHGCWLDGFLEQRLHLGVEYSIHLGVEFEVKSHTTHPLSSMESKAHAVTVTATGIKCPSSIRAKGNINIYTVLSCEQSLHVISIGKRSLTAATRLNYVKACCHVEHVKDKAQETRCVPGVLLRNLAGNSAAFFTITIITMVQTVHNICSSAISVEERLSAWLEL